MTREELIQKWLDHSLTPEEMEAFSRLEDYDELIKLDTAVQFFKAPETDTVAALQTIQTQKEKEKKYSTHTSKPTAWLRPILQVAAVLIIAFGIYVFSSQSGPTVVETTIAKKTNISLPDDSTVMLNAVSSVTFDENDWNEKRSVNLQGEAYFKVAKGATFSVITSDGIVQVLGTQFNVKQRNDLFEVFCYEGSVKVTHKENAITLQPGQRFLILNGKQLLRENPNQKEPSWIHNESSFKSLPLKEVIQEFERQYDITVDTNTIDTSQLFTGSFTHNNMELALKSITLPTQLTYQKKQNSIILKRD